MGSGGDKLKADQRHARIIINTGLQQTKALCIPREKEDVNREGNGERLKQDEAAKY